MGSHVQLFATPWTAACQASPSFAITWTLLKRLSIELVSTNHLILCSPLLPLPSISPSIRVFSNESVLHIRWPKYWSFSFSISPSSEYSGLISFRMDWLDQLKIPGHKQAWSLSCRCAIGCRRPAGGASWEKLPYCHHPLEANIKSYGDG